jgi:hypothetical protein
MSSLDIDLAIAGHKIWRNRLRYFIDGIDQDGITVERAADHTGCSLGLWIYGSGVQYNFFDTYGELVAEHQAFHEIAAEIMRLQLAGNQLEAEKLLENAFDAKSLKVIELLQGLKIDGY